MRIRGTTKTGEKYYFSMSDCPICINDRVVALVAKRNSPLLLLNTIVRGMDDEDIFEYDYVSCAKTKRFKGYVVYIDGFYSFNPKTKECVPLHEIEDFIILPNTTRTCVTELEEVRSPIKFMSNGDVFNFKRCVYFDKDIIFTDLTKLTKSANRNSISFLTGLEKGGKVLPFDKMVADGVIVLHNYRPMVKLHNGDYREVCDDDYE